MAGPQDFMDLDPLLYSAPQSFGQSSAPDQPPYDLNLETYHADDRANDHDWLSVTPDSLPLPVVHPFDSAFSVPGSSSCAAPPHPNPSTRVHRVRGYGTDPQPQDFSHENPGTFFGGTFDGADGDSDSFIVIGPHT
jgi:hypothetical protein